MVWKFYLYLNEGAIYHPCHNGTIYQTSFCIYGYGLTKERQSTMRTLWEKRQHTISLDDFTLI